MEQIIESDYKREITHYDYNDAHKNIKRGGWSRVLNLHITENKMTLYHEDVGSNEAFFNANDKFVKKPSYSYMTPQWGGSVFFLFFISFLIVEISYPEDSSWGYIVAILLFFLGFLFFLIYYFTMPKKEVILNREDGLMTFPGLFWQQNITMQIEKVMFIMSAPSHTGGGAYRLQIRRPDMTHTLFIFSSIGNCYEDLSFYLWYMDKNRPLPPGEALDAYRERDY
ncbi:hypothetical protein [Fulvivirga sediminis]|uniref:Uncharacterized protein n=1 Tax=Fulvivirga sediminis TaxID=2803949 RepID=A0A937K175_9BACT|nr:hypothetical protein [Fulvivirga sediminis]MBL3659078.1 hypothetical protein [Fulvivirga sediminis]